MAWLFKITLSEGGLFRKRNNRGARTPDNHFRQDFGTPPALPSAGDFFDVTSAAESCDKAIGALTQGPGG